LSKDDTYWITTTRS